MKTLFLILLSLFLTVNVVAQHSSKKLPEGTYLLSTPDYELLPDPKTNVLSIIPDITCQFCDSITVRIIDELTDKYIYSKTFSAFQVVIPISTKNFKLGESYRVRFEFNKSVLIKKRIIMMP